MEHQRSYAGTGLGWDWDGTGRAFTGPEDLSGEKPLLHQLCHHKSARNQLKLRDKASFVDDSHEMPLNLHLNFSWFHIPHLLYISNSQTKYDGQSSLTASSYMAWLGGFHPHSENLNLTLKTGRNSYGVCGWVVWGERPTLTTSNAEHRGLF